MLKKICITVLISALMINLGALAKESKNMTRQEIADKNLEILFNITTKNNNGPDKDFMDILQKYIFGEVFTIGDLDIKTRELLTVTSFYNIKADNIKIAKIFLAKCRFATCLYSN